MPTKIVTSPKKQEAKKKYHQFIDVWEQSQPKSATTLRNVTSTQRRSMEDWERHTLNKQRGHIDGMEPKKEIPYTRGVRSLLRLAEANKDKLLKTLLTQLIIQ